MNLLTSLKPDQKEAVKFLQRATFLEYFDIMMYVHTTIIMVQLFFPQMSSRVTALVSVLLFGSNWILRPISTYVFGYLSDQMGRKAVTLLTITLLAISCVLTATMPLYELIAMKAVWVTLACRVFQGLGSLDELTTAEIYFTETSQSSNRNPLVGLASISAALGSIAALIVLNFAPLLGFDWRAGFWVTALVGVCGSMARTSTPEASEFLQKPIQDKVDSKTIWSSFFMTAAWPVMMYFAYFYASNILKDKFGFTFEQIMLQSLMAATIGILSCVGFVYLSSKVHPLKLLRIKLACFIPFALACPYFLSNLSSPFELLLLQAFCVAFVLDNVPASAILIKHLPGSGRFTYVGLIYALSRVSAYLVTALSMIFLTEFLGHWSWYFIFIPMIAWYYWSLQHFEKLEKIPATDLPQHETSFRVIMPKVIPAYKSLNEIL